MIKRASLHIPYLIGFLIVIGLFMVSCAVPTDTPAQPTATVIPKTAPLPGPAAKEPVTGPASQVKADSIKETDKKEDLKTEVSKPKREGLPDIPANHVGRTACIACHASGVSDIPKLPSDHTGRNDAACAACHKQLGVQPVPAKAPREKKDGMEVLPSDHAGRTICTACHTTGAGGATKLPSDHAGRNDATCAACHKPSSSQPLPSDSTATATKTPAPATKDDQSQAKKTGPPGIPINHQGRATCTMCHEAGIAGAPKNPADHAGRTDSTCAACHKQVSASPGPAVSTPSPAPTLSKAGPPNTPVNHRGRTTCTVCHEAGVMGAPKTPASHSGRTDATCIACHKQAS